MSEKGTQESWENSKTGEKIKSVRMSSVQSGTECNCHRREIFFLPCDIMDSLVAIII